MGFENEAKKYGYGPLAPCGHIIANSQQETLCRESAFGLVLFTQLGKG